MSKTTLTFSKLPLHPLSRCEHPKILSCLLHRQRSEQLSSPIHLKSVKKFYALKVFLMLLLLSEFLKKNSNTYTLFPAKCRMKNLRIVCRSQTHYFFCKILRAQKRKKIWCVNSFNDQITHFLSFFVNLVNFITFYYQSTTTEVCTTWSLSEKQGRHPWVFVRCCFIASNDEHIYKVIKKD